MVTTHRSGQTIPVLFHIKGTILGADEKIQEVAVRASGMGLDRIGEVSDRASEVGAAGM